MDGPTHPEAPLPDILGVAPPEHGLLGRVLILLIHTCAAWVLALALIAPAGDGRPVGECVTTAALGGLGCAALMYLAEGVRRFRCWAWFFVAAWLALPLPGVLAMLMSPIDSLTEDATSFAGGVMLIGGGVLPVAAAVGFLGRCAPGCAVQGSAWRIAGVVRSAPGAACRGSAAPSRGSRRGGAVGTPPRMRQLMLPSPPRLHRPVPLLA